MYVICAIQLKVIVRYNNSLEITRQVQQFLPTSALDSCPPTKQLTSGLVLRLSYLKSQTRDAPTKCHTTAD